MNIALLIPLFINRIGGPQFLIILVIVLLLFGGKKIPELMHGIGKGVRSFKKGLSDIEEEVKDIDKEEQKKPQA
ncbi:MAG: twin-arginine translocase TatA/TatE family subunit [Odoribacter sp.]|nr:twin-arginine translocase TatA/TatE family subunit [Odoribacter sp.]